jgi:glycosyltransferase involved in cell wall biosynthesis
MTSPGALQGSTWSGRSWPERTRVSVIIPARNAAATIDAQLAALSRQSYDGWWEVIVVDNGSDDATAVVAKAWRPRLPNLRVIDASDESRPGYARNMGCRASRGELLLFCDADDVVDDDWVTALTKGLVDYSAVGGRIDRLALNEATVLAWRPARPTDALPDHFGFLPYAQGANCGVRKEVWSRLGGFDERVPHSEDVAFFWRVQLVVGDEVGYIPGAVVSYRYRSSIWATVRQGYGYGKSHAWLYKQFAAHGMPRRNAGGGWHACSQLPFHPWAALRSRQAPGAWLTNLGRRCGRLVGSLRHRISYL